jgi:hypothetical protein
MAGIQLQSNFATLLATIMLAVHHFESQLPGWLLPMQPLSIVQVDQAISKTSKGKAY